MEGGEYEDMANNFSRGLLRLQLEEYASKTKNESSRIERTKTYFEESQKKISERPVKIQQFADEIERVKQSSYRQ